MKSNLFRIKCITNLHVGGGDSNYSIIDNEVQKDSVLPDVPVIHASSLKGALKEHFEKKLKVSADVLLEVFGGLKDEPDGTGKIKKVTIEGQYKFLDALLFARPLRVSDGADGAPPYILTTTPEILNRFSGLLKYLGLKTGYTDASIEPNGSILTSESNINQIENENARHDPLLDSLKKFVGEPIAVARKLDLLDYPLPVIARNALDDNGISKNLWYEEVVPHQSIFYFAVLTPKDECKMKLLEGQQVQIGANGSVGYGYTEVTEVLCLE